MHPKDIALYIERYNRRLDEYGYDARALGWGGGRERQRVRFKALKDIGITPHCSVLDVGCGFCDFFGYLAESGWRGRYLGIDINQALLDVAAAQYPGVEVRRLDISTEPLSESFDWVCASGVFNARLHHQENAQHIENTLGRMFRLADKGVACDFMSTYVDFQNEEAYHSDPGATIALARRLSWKVAVRLDYLRYEFMLYVYR